MKKKSIAILSLVALAIVFMGATAVSAAGNSKAEKNRNTNCPALTDEQKVEIQEMKDMQDALQTALEQGDYNTWKETEEKIQAKQVNILNVINESNFAKYSEMHQLMKDGQVDEAKVIAEELGLKNVHGMGMGMGMRDRGMGHGRGEPPIESENIEVTE